MDKEALRALWQEEERAAFQGWDFSRLNGRVREGALPWRYEEEVRRLLKPGHRLLDMGTGGGEFLLGLGHPPELTWVTEGWPPNLRLCRKRLSPLGVVVAEVGDDDRLPFPDQSFDLILNRHESFDPGQVYRCLSPGGHFITQQVGGRNGRELSRRLIPGFSPAYPSHDLAHGRALMEAAGFCILKAEEAFPKLSFLDIGALVYHARQLPWEFPGFSVDACLEQLLACQSELEERGALASLEHRFLILARRPA